MLAKLPRTAIPAVLSGCLLAASLPSCISLSPKYTAPQLETSAKWQNLTSPGSATQLANWWKIFSDKQLDGLVQSSLEQNLDLQQAANLVKQAKAQRRIASSALFPQLNANSSARRNYTQGGDNSFANYSIGSDLAWEIDVFGGNSSALAASEQEVLAAYATRDDVRVALLAELALNYFDWIAYEQQLEITRQQLAYQQESAIIANTLFEGGFTSLLDVNSAKAQVASTEALLPSLRAASYRSLANVALLCGRTVSNFKLQRPAEKVANFVPKLKAGVPSELLARRPDLRAQEAQVRASLQRIGEAKANLYPRFSLTGSLNNSGNAQDFLDKISTGYSLGSFVDIPIFNAGRLRANVELSRIASEQQSLRYRQLWLQAVNEVETTLLSFAQNTLRKQSLETAVQANGEAVKLARELYTNGKTDFLNLINAQQSLLNSQEALVLVRKNQRRDLALLCKALGGGWNAKVK